MLLSKIIAFLCDYGGPDFETRSPAIKSVCLLQIGVTDKSSDKNFSEN